MEVEDGEAEEREDEMEGGRGGAAVAREPDRWA